MEISSPSNPKLKYVVKLRSCSTREESGEMIVEGYRECRRALDNGYRIHSSAPAIRQVRWTLPI